MIDVHTHIFPDVRGLTGRGPTRALGYGRILWGAEQIQAYPPLSDGVAHTAEMLIAHMDWAGVEKSVLLQGSFYGACNSYVLDAVHRHPDRLMGAAYVDPWARDFRTAFEQICESGGYCAIKLECSEAAGLCGLHAEARLDCPDLLWFWDELERSGLVLVFDLGAIGSKSYQTSAVRAIAESHPRLRVVIAHLAQPSPCMDTGGPLLRAWEDQISLGLLSNVWFDTAALPAYLPDEDYPYPGAGVYVHRAIDLIGPAKVMWGTDIPGLLAQVTYPQLVKLAKMWVQFLPESDRKLVLGETAHQVFAQR